MKNNKLIIILSFIVILAGFSALFYLRFRTAPQTEPTPTAAVTASPTAAPTPEPTPDPTPEPTPEYFTISMVGDCTLSSSQYNDHFEETLDGDMSWPFSGTVQYFEDDYLTIANLECSFSDEPLSASVTFQFLAPTAHAKILTDGGVDFVTLSNNHTSDFGDEGLADTENALDSAGVAWAAPDGSCIYQTEDGITIGLYSARWIATEDEIVAGVKALREQEDVDLVIALMHWGLEGSYRVTDGQAQLGHAAIDAGADFVYGSHPHVLQKVEEYNGGYIFNSLGNWSFGGNTAPRDRDTAVIQVTVKRDVNGEISLEDWQAIPCCLSSTPGVNDYRPEPYAEGSEDWTRAMSKLDGSWTGPDLVVDYSAYHQNDDTAAAAADSSEPDTSAEG
ncbi:MAG: CapA family protein [Clostridia bacterium]|nr:CapA family protein [Clostridia bacterium]